MIPALIAVALLLLGWAVPAGAQQPEPSKYELTILRVEPVVPVGATGTQMFATFKTTTTNVPAERLAENFKNFMEAMGRVFQAAPNALGDSTLDQIELHLDISAEGKILLIAGASVGAGIKVTFKRQPKAATTAQRQ